MSALPKNLAPESERPTNHRVGLYLKALCAQGELNDTPDVQIYDARIKPLAVASRMLAEDEILFGDCLKQFLGMGGKDSVKPLITRLNARLRESGKITAGERF